MNTILNSLTSEQVEFIVNAYGTVEGWFAHYGTAARIAIEDMML